MNLLLRRADDGWGETELTGGRERMEESVLELSWGWGQKQQRRWEEHQQSRPGDLWGRRSCNKVCRYRQAVSSTETNAHPQTAENKRLKWHLRGLPRRTANLCCRRQLSGKIIRRSERQHVFSTCFYKSVSLSLNPGIWEGMCDNGERLPSSISVFRTINTDTHRHTHTSAEGDKALEHNGAWSSGASHDSGGCLWTIMQLVTKQCGDFWRCVCVCAGVSAWACCADLIWCQAIWPWAALITVVCSSSSSSSIYESPSYWFESINST